ncbi:MAG TPA: hypothetical protein PKE38_00410 [Ignavibacteriaceae bacterium]|nr:hypothetical protein [Ignavibacteriaceae bacterium]
MKENTKGVFDKLKYEVTRCHYYWIVYRQLLGTSESRIELINKTTPSFFILFQDLFLDYITLQISKLTDPADYRKYKNFSFYYLLELLKQESPIKFYEKLSSILEKLQVKSALFRDRRNKVVAHRDLDSISNKSEYGISRESVEAVLQVIREYLNEIDFHFFNTTTLYEEFITDLKDDGVALLVRLAKSLAYDDLVQQKKIEIKLWENYSKIF